MKNYIKILTELGFEDYEIEDKIYEKKTLDGWRAITVGELKDMDESNYPNILSFTWHDGECRCDTIGISDVEIIRNKYDRDDEESYDISWSDGNGDPSIGGYILESEIDNIGDGTWNYGLYIKK